MVKEPVEQGDIIKLDFPTHSGHEQAGYRPALVISNKMFNEKTNMTIVCPITNTDNVFPLHVPLDVRTHTTGVILCEHVKALDIASRNYKVVEQVPSNILQKVIHVVTAQIEYL